MIYDEPDFCACCPHCDGGPFEDQDEWFEHTAMCPDNPDVFGLEDDEY